MNAVEKTATELAVPLVTESGGVLALIERAAKDPAVNVQNMQVLKEMWDAERERQAEAAFSEAMAACQAEMVPIVAKANNPQTKSRYAKYHHLDAALRPVYLKHGFALSFDTEPMEQGDPPLLPVLCHVSHRGGHTRTYRSPIPCDGKGIAGNPAMTKTHAVGSAMTYGKRYLVILIFNLAIISADDDDGNAAMTSVADREATDPIYDKIDLAENLEQLRSVRPLVEDVKCSQPTRRNLIAAYKAKFNKLGGGK